MGAEIKNRYSDKDLEAFKMLIQEKIEKAEHDLELIKSAYMNDHNNGTDDTSPTFKAFEEGSATMSKESNSALAISPLQQQYGQLRSAHARRRQAR